uniref:EB domain-containing protein n=1 Tax=Glossina brevipalpis TaxID=37001 RepID=A0A1A9W3L4_9MUSC
MPSAAYCKSGICDCTDGESYIEGSCKQLKNLQQYYDKNQICAFGHDRDSVQYTKSICACANGYYWRDGNICRRKSMEIDDAYLVKADCQNLSENVKCINLKCQHVNEIKAISTLPVKDTAIFSINEPEKQYSISSEFSSGEYIQPQRIVLKEQLWNDERNAHNKWGISGDNKTNIDKFQNNFISLESNVIDFNTSKDFKEENCYFDSSNIYCTSSHLVGTENGKPCPKLPYSFCSRHKCFCRRSYYHKHGKCFAELRELSLSSGECENEPNIIDKKCVCLENYFYEESLKECRKPTQFRLSCTSDSQCSQFGYDYRHLEVPRLCTCEEYAEYNAILQMRVCKGTLSVKCDGRQARQSLCSNNRCKCGKFYLENEHKYDTEVGGVCTRNDDCFSQNSECIHSHSSSNEEKDKICQCHRGFVHFGEGCLSEAEDKEECVDSEQTQLLGATCNYGRYSYTPQQRFMKSYVGERCSKAAECYTEANSAKVECPNSVCPCRHDFQNDVAKKDCVRLVPSKKNHSGKPSALKVVTFLLIGSAFLVTSAAIKQAYY